MVSDKNISHVVVQQLLLINIVSSNKRKSRDCVSILCPSVIHSCCHSAGDTRAIFVNLSRRKICSDNAEHMPPAQIFKERLTKK